MGYFIIEGGHRLCGSVKVQGAKNAVLPILSACLLNGGTSVLHNCPALTDVTASLDILKFLGCDVEVDGNTVTVNSKNACADFIPDVLMQKMRSSIIFAGSMLARCKRASVSLPGGCVLGKRPIDIHLTSFEKLGADILENDGQILCSMEKLQPCDIFLPFPSVGATENIMLVSCVSDGVTTIRNAAREPEINDLQDFLNAMGASVSGAGTDTVIIKGVKKLHDASFSIMPDRIAATTYMAAVVAAGGEAELLNVKPAHFECVTKIFEKCGADIRCEENSLYIKAPQKIKSANRIVTMPYPGFPTDCQSVMMAVLATAGGESVIEEKIFDQRFANAYELIKMGADITLDGSTAYIRGVDRLHSASVFARDLRSGASLVVAALGADGKTEIFNTKYIDRGYEAFDINIQKLGGVITRFDDTY